MPDADAQNGYLNLFISYAHEDRESCAQLITHLSNLINQGVISHWYDGEMIAGEVWDDKIKEQLAAAKIIVLLISPDFFASEYIKNVEVAHAMARLKETEVTVIPVILRPSDWMATPFGALHALPDGALPITKWPDRDEGFLSVVSGIRKVIENLSVSPFVGRQKSGRTRVEQKLKVSRPGILRYLLDRYFPSLHRLLTNHGTLTKPAEVDVLNDYLRDARANIENDIRHKTYIPLAGKEVASTPFQHTQGTDPFVPPMQRVIRQVVGLDRGGDSASAQIAAVNRSSRVIRNIIKTLLGADDPLVLLGDPGTGKTMTLQQTALVLFESEIRRLFPIVTIYIRLGEFYVQGRGATPEDVWNYVKTSVSPEISPYLEDLDNAGRLILLFDGMDEMSRERYGEHTEALSIFAASRKDQTKTLFSCRITDFSPKFMHRRLVLLPFSHEQIGEYLRRYIQSFPLMIEDQPWSLKKLVKQLLSGSLPLEATNPFVLWLLCFQLQQKGSWPASRVELLRYYLEETFRRKAEDVADDEPAFPPVDQALSGWSKLAYTITSLNRGAAITVLSLSESAVAADIEELIRIGKRCGVLQETSSEDETQIRFEHHRFQEFFTARYIHHFNTEIDWLSRLDAPRWQETMVNLILMGGGEDAIKTLADSIEAGITPSETVDETADDVDDLDESYEDEDEDEEEENTESETSAPALPPATSETIVADRIELASRIVRQAASTSTIVNTTLTDTLKKAVRHLSQNGNPITQVKMMRACQNVPAVDIFEVTRTALASPINWVRNQAIIIASSSNRDAPSVGAHFATELGYDLANGLLPLRLKAYTKAAAASKRLRNWWSLGLGASCYFVNAVLLLACAGVIYWSLWKRFSVSSVLDGWIYVAGCAVLTIGAIGLAIKFDLSQLWLAILGVACGTYALAFLIEAAAMGFGFVLMTGFLLIPLVSLAAAFLISPVSVGIHFLILGIYLVASAPVRRSVAAGSYFAAAWRNCNFRHFFIETAKFSGQCLMIFLVSGVFMLVVWGIYQLTRVLQLPFPTLVNMAIVIVALALIASLIVLLARRRTGDSKAVLRSLFGVVAFIFLLGGFVFVVGWSRKRFSGALSRWIPSLAGSTRMWIVGTILTVLVAAGLCYTLWLFLRRLQILVPWKKTKPDDPESEREWKRKFAGASPDLQEAFLSQTNHQTLGLTAVEFLNALQEIERFVNSEPALSAYWDKRDRLEQVLRQEHLG